MSGGFLAGLGLVVTAFLAARIALPGLPLAGPGRSVTTPEALLIAAGVLGLTFHCLAMFYPSIAGAIPGTAAAIRQINAMDAVSRAWFVVAALLVLAGLRHQILAAVCLVAAAFVGVGVTMYDGGPLGRHLTAIFLSVMALSGIAALLISPPRRRGSHGVTMA